MGDEQLQGQEWVAALWQPSVEAEPLARTAAGQVAPEGADTRQRRELLERQALDAIDRLLAAG